jgi:hypothetical protein
VVGFCQLHLGLFASTPVNLAALRELCDIVGGAIFVRRAFAINRDGVAGRLVAGGGALAAATPRHIASTGVSGGGGAAGAAAESEPRLPYPASDADAAMLAALDARAAADKSQLLRWSLDAWTLPDEEVQRLFVAQFHSLGLPRRFRISPTAFAAFVADVASHYNGA